MEDRIDARRPVAAQRVLITRYVALRPDSQAVLEEQVRVSILALSRRVASDVPIRPVVYTSWVDGGVYLAVDVLVVRRDDIDEPGVHQDLTRYAEQRWMPPLV